MEYEGNATARLDRVEGEVAEIRAGLGELRSELRNVGSFIGRIEGTLRDWQEREDRRAAASKPNITALVSMLITIVSILIGGAWLIAGQTARFDERDRQRDREIERMKDEMDRIEARVWRQNTRG